MSYTPTTWAAGDTVTAAKLNKLEQGVASSGALVKIPVTSSGDDLVLGKTGQEIIDYLTEGLIPYVEYDPSRGEIQGALSIGLFTGMETDRGGSMMTSEYYFNFASISFYCSPLSNYPVSNG